MLNLVDQELVFRDNYNDTTAGTRDTDWLDLFKHGGNKSMYGQAQQLALIVQINGDAGADATYEFQLQMADDDSGTNEEVVVTSGTLAPADLPDGKVLVLPIPKLDTFRRFVQLTTVLANDGSAPDVTFSARLGKQINVPHATQHAMQTGW